MRKLTTIKERLLHFVDNQGIKKEDFYTKIEIDGANFRGKNLNSEFSVDKIVKILRLFPQISTDWLLFGNGEMLKDANAIPKCSEPPVFYKTEETIKDKYIEVLEENRELHKEIKALLKSSSGNIKKQNNCDSVCQM